MIIEMNIGQSCTGGRYEATMLRVLKEAQYDDNLVGFYQSTNMGAFMRQSWITTHASRHETLRQGGIALVHGMYAIRTRRKASANVLLDASQTSRGNASLRAFRLTKSFLETNRAGKFNSQR